MICPDCQGKGEVTRRFLWFFSRHRVCPNCDGTGRLGTIHSKARAIAPRIEDRRSDNFRDRTDDRFASSSRGSLHERDEPFVAGSGGTSGGGGGGASWGDETGSRDAAARDDRDSPVIVDPFVVDGASAAASDAGSADAGSGSADGGWGSDGSSSGDSGSGSDSGTAY